MKISDILRYKGSAVATIAPGEQVTELLSRLAEHDIGALVVIDGETVAGIVSERDIARRLNDHGTALLTVTVAEVMTAAIASCAPGDSVDAVAETMTDLHVRHMPVLADGKLVGIVSIGDVVAGRIRQLEHDRGHLENYITQG